MPFTPETAHTGTQWQPGQSGNPAGTKKGTKHLTTWIQELLNDEEFETVVTDAKTGVKDYKGAPLKAIIQAQMHLALHSRDENVRIKATDLLMKHGYGTKQVLAGDSDNPIVTRSDMTEEEIRERLRQLASET